MGTTLPQANSWEYLHQSPNNLSPICRYWGSAILFFVNIGRVAIEVQDEAYRCVGKKMAEKWWLGWAPCYWGRCNFPFIWGEIIGGHQKRERYWGTTGARKKHSDPQYDSFMGIGGPLKMLLTHTFWEHTARGLFFVRTRVWALVRSLTGSQLEDLPPCYKHVLGKIIVIQTW